MYLICYFYTDNVSILLHFHTQQCVISRLFSFVKRSVSPTPRTLTNLSDLHSWHGPNTHKHYQFLQVPLAFPRYPSVHIPNTVLSQGEIVADKYLHETVQTHALCRLFVDSCNLSGTTLADHFGQVQCGDSHDQWQPNALCLTRFGWNYNKYRKQQH